VQTARQLSTHQQLILGAALRVTKGLATQQQQQGQTATTHLQAEARATWPNDRFTADQHYSSGVDTLDKKATC
jgi:hypothetical protein